tara:strand:- start:591 stop:821 length:231 start_codon:yes stop_codon:yes gene_type:complete
MKFNQKEDGSFDIVFLDEEIKILNKFKKLQLSKESTKHFINNLSKALFHINQALDEETKKLSTFNDTEIISNKPKK